MYTYIEDALDIWDCVGLVHGAEQDTIWMVPAPCYPAPDAGAIIDAIRHAR